MLKKKQPLIPKLHNLNALVEVQQPMSCRSSRGPAQIGFIQNAIKTSRQKENTQKFIKQQSKSNNNSINKPASPTQSSQSILNMLMHRKESKEVQPKEVQSKSNITPDKREEQDLYYQIIKQRTQNKKFYCHQHQNKKAKFYVYPKDRIYLCSLCAIQEAYDGKAIIWDAETNEQIPKRLKDDEWTIDNHYPANSDKFKKVQQLQEFLQLARQLYEAAKKHKDKQIQQHNVNDILDEIQQISRDILGNVPNIIANLDQRPFQLIMQSYVTKLQNFEQILTQQQRMLKQPKQIYISFQNKDSFMSPDQLQSTDSLVLRQSEEQHFLNEFNDIYSPNF